MKFYNISKIKQLFAKKHPAALLAAAAIMVLCSLAVAGESLLPKELQLDPMSGLWKDRVFPKQRLLLSFRTRTSSGYGMKTIVATKKEIGDGSLEGTLSEISPSNFGRSGSSYYVYEQAGVEGLVPEDVKINPDFYGLTTIKNVPKNILVNSYLLRSDTGHKNEDGELWLEVMDNNKKVRLVKLNPPLRPRYSVYWYGNLTWINRPALDTNTNHDIKAYDWNNDGYSDYAISYIAAEGNGDSGYPCTVIVMVDGKELWDYVSGKTTKLPNARTINGSNGSSYSDRGNIVGGTMEAFPPHSYRMAIGDFDGDGTPEVAMAYTKITGCGLGAQRPNKLEIYKITVTPKETNYSGAKVYTDEKAGGNVVQNDSLGLAAGDINGDGKAELVEFHSHPDLLYGYPTVYMNMYIYENGSYVKKLSDVSVETTYMHTGNADSVTPFHAEFADLDGDKTKELIWACSDSDDKEELILHVAKWDTYYGEGLTSYMPATTDRVSVRGLLGKDMNYLYQKYDICTGVFGYPTAGNTTAVSQIAIAMLGEEKSSSGNADLHYAVINWNSSESFRVVLNKTIDNEISSSGNCAPNVTAVDIYRESMILGEPTVINVENNIELMMLTQAPPKHWDVIKAAGTFMDHYDYYYKDQNGLVWPGMVPMDSMSHVEGEAFSTNLVTSNTYGRSETITDVSSGNFSFGASFQILRRNSDVAGNKTWGEKPDPDPLFDGGAKYSMTKVDQYTNAYKKNMVVNVTSRADRDDLLYYVANNYNLLRYPVLFPEDKRYQDLSRDPSLNGIKAQNYLQVIVPTETSDSLTPAAGKDVEWYEPMHDGYNLFTYPKKFNQVIGFPLGKEFKPENDPWEDINGKVLLKTKNIKIGAQNTQTIEMKVSDADSKSHLDSIRHAIQAHASGHPTFGSTGEYKLKLDMEGGGGWGKDTTTTQDASAMLDVTANIPGASSYTAAIPKWTHEDMQFSADLAYYTQDDGALCVSYIVPDLKQTNSTSGMWSAISPYFAAPDPGLILPYRWNTDLRDVKAIHGLTPNYSINNRYIRGVQIETVSGNSTPSPNPNGTVNYEGAGTRLMPIGPDCKISVRVVNYSFVNTKPQDVKVNFYLERFRNGTALKDNLASSCPSVDENCINLNELDNSGYKKDVLGIKGRTNSSDDSNNWDTASVLYKTAGEKPGLAWLHVEVVTSGDELLKENNHGYTLVGLYNEAEVCGYDDVASGASLASAPAVVAPAVRPDLAITDLQVYEVKKDKKGAVVYDENGNVIYEKTKLDKDSRHKKLRIEATVAVKEGILPRHGGNRKINYLPLVRTALLSGKGKTVTSIISGKSLPLMKAGTTEKMVFDYDPANCDPNNKLVVMAFSPFLIEAEQKDPTSQIKVLWEEEQSSGSSGCNAGYAGIALLLMMPVAALLKKKR